MIVCSVIEQNHHFKWRHGHLLSSMEAVMVLGIRDCQFVTDSEVLVRTLRPQGRMQSLLITDWRAYPYLVRIVQILSSHAQFHCIFRPREENERAHNLANLARTLKVSYTGYTYPLFLFR